MTIPISGVILLGLTSILLASCTVTRQDTPSIFPQSTEITPIVTTTQDTLPEFSLSEKEFDFGIIKQSGGKVEHTFIVTYNGDTPLTITGVPTSCACTAATIDKTTLSTGESANFTVVFDPNLHAEPEGKFFKTVSLLTDPTITDSPELKIWVEIDLDLGKDSYKLKSEHID